VRGTLHSPQRYLEGHFKTLGGGSRNGVRSGGGEHVANELDGLTHHIGEARSKTRMFERPNGSSQRCQVFRCHPRQVQSLRFMSGSGVPFEPTRSSPRCAVEEIVPRQAIADPRTMQSDQLQLSRRLRQHLVRLRDSGSSLYRCPNVWLQRKPKSRRLPKGLGERSNSIPPWRSGLVATLGRFLKRLRYKVEFGSTGFVSSSRPVAKAASW